VATITDKRSHSDFENLASPLNATEVAHRELNRAIPAPLSDILHGIPAAPDYAEMTIAREIARGMFILKQGARKTVIATIVVIADVEIPPRPPNDYFVNCKIWVIVRLYSPFIPKIEYRDGPVN